MENAEAPNEPRAKRQKTKHHKSAFERLKALKGRGSKNKYEVSDVDNVYEVVDEKEYSKNVFERQEDDWIVDDDGSGYVEDGRDIFDDDLDGESVAAASRSVEGRKKKKNVSKNAGKGNIHALLSNMPEKKKEVVNLEQDDILSDLLSGVDDTCTSDANGKNKNFSEETLAKDYMKSFSVPKPMKVKLKNTSKVEKPKVTEILKELPVEENIIEEYVPDTIEDTFEDIEEEQEVIQPEKTEFKDCDDEFLANIETDINIENKETENEDKENKNEENLMNDDMDMFDGEFDFENICNDPKIEENIDNSQLPLIKNSQNDQVFRFYWWDAFEDTMKQPGTIFLFGKTYVASAKTYASCCVAVRNIERKIFLLPRPFKLDDTKKETNEPVKLVDVYQEFNNEISDKVHIQQFRSRKESKKYAFDPDVPLQSDYLEVRYSGKYRSLEKSEKSGRTYSRVFGTNSSFLEIFLLERKIKGPCWIEIKNPMNVTNPLSWCKFEVNCATPVDVIIPEDKKISPPPLVVATINIRTVVGSTPRDNEIVMIGCLVHNKFHIDKQPPNPPFQQHFCLFTKPTNQVLPLDVQETIKNFKGSVEKCDSEKGLLNVFLSRFGTIDPDLVVGHDLIDFHFHVLCDRIEKAKTAKWSRFGKLKRTIIPTKFFCKDLMIGRLVCDLKVSARELIKSRSYDLDALCQTVLKLKEGERPDLESGDVLKMFSNSPSLVKLINFTMQDASHIIKMMYELNVMPLALQITNIAGNVMSKTLQGGRAQRNEYLLLHAFTEKNYICPDKVSAKAKQDAENVPSTSSRKKPTYSGGLVLDPKVGFYDKLILLMDFNSLYPSIIQEYNICFTTMQANLDTESMLSCVKNEPGILPTEIRKLVESRREVKKLMANPDISNDLKMQYNIRQLALKLTANSMYGCLGFQNSRFFAKHLASLVTMKGRDILMHTRDLVQSLGFEVVYGDTDSIMINTNIVDYEQVFKIGNTIKQLVNKSYRQVELDIDGVFKYMLLLKKKKYAAVTISKSKKGDIVLQQEHKGLDIVRRDWSMLASEVGKMILNHILSEQSADERIENVQGVLNKVASDLKEGNIPTTLLVITKQLTKSPNQYPDKVPLSHVLVALRYNKKGGKPLGQGDTVPYIICEDGTTASATQRAYHVEEFKRSDNLKIDINYYLSQQIHPVVSRLCEPIEGLDAYQIANYLNIDATAFKKSKPKQAMTDNEMISAPVKKFRNAKAFEFVCVACKQTNTVKSPVVKNGSDSYLWIEKCCNTQCNVKPIEYLYSIENKIVQSIKESMNKYYDKVLICEDPCCPNETNVVPLKFSGKYPVCTLCNSGVMYRKFPEENLYEQICFYRHLCDTSKLDKRICNSDIEEAYQRIKETIDYFLQKCAYSVVDLTELYSKVSLSVCKEEGENNGIPFVYDADFELDEEADEEMEEEPEDV